MRGLSIAIAAFVVASFSCAAAWSDPFGAAVTATPPGPSAVESWVYTLTNTSSSPDYVAWLLQIEVDVQTAVISSTSPKGWMASVDPQTPNLVTWFCSGDYLTSKASLSGFGVTYTSKPLYQGWTVMLDNEQVPGDSPVVFGDVVIPEPGSALAVLVGVISMAGLAGRRRN